MTHFIYLLPFFAIVESMKRSFWIVFIPCIIKDYNYGVPDILIEVLSEGNGDHDLVREKELYQKFGVKE